MEHLIDFTNCKKNNTYLYRGQNGKKVGIEYNNEVYMLKFPSYKKDIGTYSNSSISEYIACHIFEEIGFNTQKTLLGKYIMPDGEEKIVVACKDFTQENLVLKEFAELKNSIIELSSYSGYGTELDEVLDTISSQELYPKKELLNFFWDMFIVDSLLGNFDRHNGNWGFLINRDTEEVKLAPIFDCASCLYPQLDDNGIAEILSSDDEIDKRVYTFPNSALKINDKKINYYEFMKNNSYSECTESLLRIYPKINLDNINKIIDEAEILDIRKEFYKRMIKERYDKILTPPYKETIKDM